MENLAGRKDCDLQIRKELKEAGIELVCHPEPPRNEVPASVTGKLGEFTFTRAWYYWMVDGDIPLNVAEEMYANPIGKKDVRVAGHCGCPPPREWAFPKMEVLNEKGIIKLPDEKHRFRQGPTYGELARMCNSGKINAPRLVENYHIDSQEGLNLFTSTLRKHNLVPQENEEDKTTAQEQ